MGIDFEWFIKDFSKSWIIENLWTDEQLTLLGLKKKTHNISINDFNLFLLEIIEDVNSLQQLSDFAIEGIKYQDIKLIDNRFFEKQASQVGKTKVQYSQLDSKDSRDFPVFTASLQPVAYFKEIIENKIKRASKQQPHISFANDGDGTAETNIILHKSPYYINSSRHSFKVLNNSIDPEYVFWLMQDIKEKYRFNYTHKATLSNLKKLP